jgi:hypothetical protein
MIAKDKQPPILPEQVVHYAWGLTLTSSSGGEPTTTPEEIRNSIKTPETAWRSSYISAKKRVVKQKRT